MVTTTSSHYIPKENEYIINISDQLPNITLEGTDTILHKNISIKLQGYMGIHIKTNLQDMYFVIENEHFCCEEYDVYMKNKTDTLVDYQELKDKQIKSIKLKCGTDDYEITDEDGTIYTITIKNDHSGYYPHIYVVKYGDYFDQDEI